MRYTTVRLPIADSVFVDSRSVKKSKKTCDESGSDKVPKMSIFWDGVPNETATKPDEKSSSFLSLKKGGLISIKVVTWRFLDIVC